MENYEKKYKNALEWARQVMNGETGFIRKEVENIFPELAESEDEKIRKELIEHIKANKWADYVLFQKFSPEDVIAWLESIKDRVQPHWKPSGEQIDAFEHFVKSIGESGFAYPHNHNTKCVYSLLNDLKKL